MISVTAVDVTPDLKFGKVYISVLDKGDSSQVLKGLKSGAGRSLADMNMHRFQGLVFIGPEINPVGADFKNLRHCQSPPPLVKGRGTAAEGGGGGIPYPRTF